MSLIYTEEKDNQDGNKDMGLASLNFSHQKMLNPFHMQY